MARGTAAGCREKVKSVLALTHVLHTASSREEILTAVNAAPNDIKWWRDNRHRMDVTVDYAECLGSGAFGQIYAAGPGLAIKLCVVNKFQRQVLKLEGALQHFAANAHLAEVIGWAEVEVPKSVAAAASPDSTVAAGEWEATQWGLVLRRMHATLEQELYEEGPQGERRVACSVATFCNVLRQAFTGVQALHSIGIVHNDLALRNVMVDRPLREPGVQVVLIDLGLASQTGSAAPRIVGDVTDAPEVVLAVEGSSTVDTPVDVFALSLSAYFAALGITGYGLHRPGVAGQLMVEQLSRRRGEGGQPLMAYNLPPLLVAGTEGLSRMLRRGITMDPAQRITCEAFLAELGPCSPSASFPATAFCGEKQLYEQRKAHGLASEVEGLKEEVERVNCENCFLQEMQNIAQCDSHGLGVERARMGERLHKERHAARKLLEQAAKQSQELEAYRAQQLVLKNQLASAQDEIARLRESAHALPGNDTLRVPSLELQASACDSCNFSRPMRSDSGGLQCDAVNSDFVHCPLLVGSPMPPESMLKTTCKLEEESKQRRKCRPLSRVTQRWKALRDRADNATSCARTTAFAAAADLWRALLHR